jgi:hypothetical protein
VDTIFGWFVGLVPFFAMLGIGIMLNNRDEKIAELEEKLNNAQL